MTVKCLDQSLVYTSAAFSISLVGSWRMLNTFALWPLVLRKVSEGWFTVPMAGEHGKSFLLMLRVPHP